MSTKPMTDDELDAIHGRLAAITEWPWIAFCRTGVRHRMGITNKRLFDDGDAPEVLDVVELGDNAGGIKSEADAAFIAAAPTDIARLLAEVERLRDENEALKNSAFEFGVGFSTKVNEMRAREEWLSRELARLDKEADWLVKMLSHYTEDCPLKFSWLYAEELPIPKIDGCDGAWPDDDYFDCSNSTPGRCWREAARKAVEEEERYG